MKIFLKPHPFKFATTPLEVDDGLTAGAVSALVANQFPTHRLDINGGLVDPEQDAGRVLTDTDLVLVYAIPQGPGLLAPFLISLAVSVALAGATIAITYLLRPKTPKLGKADSIHHFLDGIGNETAPFGPMPKIYGTVRQFPRFPGKFPTQYTEVAGDKQYLRVYLSVGKGPVTINPVNIRLGETRLDDKEDVDYEVFEGKSTDPPNSLFTNAMTEEPLAIALTQAADWQVQTTQLGIDEISVDWTFVRGLQHSTKNGGRDARLVNVEIGYKLTTEPSVWTSLLGTITDLRVTLKIGSLDDVSNMVIVQSNVIGRFETGGVRQYHYFYTIKEGDLLSSLSGLGTIVVNGEYLKGQTRTHSDTVVDGAEASNPAVDTSGAVKIEVIAFPATYSQVGEVITFVTTVWNIETTGVFGTTGKTLSAIRRNQSWRVTNVPSVAYNVRMRRTTADGGSADVDETTWTALRSITHVDPFNEPEEAGIALRIRATDQLNGQIDNLNMLVQGETLIDDGTAWTGPVGNENPAWAVADILCGNANLRPIPRTFLDADSFKEGADWCTSRFLSFNYEFNNDTTVMEAAQKAAAAGLMSLDRVDGKYVLIIDRQQPSVVTHITPRNSWDFEGKASYPHELHALRIGFKNVLLDYADDERVVYDDGYSAANAMKYEFLQYEGIVHPNRIHVLGRRELATRQLRFEEWAVTMDFERLRATRGDLVVLSHDVMLVGLGWGRIVSLQLAGGGANVGSVVIDAIVIMDPAKTYGVQIRTVLGEMIEMQVVNTGNETNRFNFIFPVIGASVGDLVTFGEMGTISQRCIVMAVRPTNENGHLAARLTLQAEAPGIYTADTQEIPDHVPIITLTAHPANIRPPTPRIRFIRTDGTVAILQDNGSYGAELVVAVTFESSFNAARVWIQAQYRLLDSGGPWLNTPYADGSDGEIFIPGVHVLAIYEVRVRALNKLNDALISPWTDTTEYAIEGDLVAPAYPGSATAQAGDRMVTLRWINPKDEGGLLDEVDFCVVEIWRSLFDDFGSSPQTGVYLGETSGEAYADTKLENGTPYYYGLRSRDFAGNLSVMVALLAVTPTPNVIINKAEARDASDSLSATEEFLTLTYVSKGNKLRVEARAYISMPTNNPSDSQTTQLALTRNADLIDTYNIALAHVGPGYPGVMAFHYEDQPAAGSFTYKLYWGGSSATVNATNIAIFIEEIEV